jgi:hypothetical protein
VHDLYAEWSEMAYLMEDAATIQRLADSLLRYGQARNSPLLIGTALNIASDASMVLNQFSDGLKLTESAFPHLESSGSLFELMEAYNHRGVFLTMLNRVDEAIPSFQDALAVGADSDALPVVRARANAHYQLAVAWTLHGSPE